MATMEIIQEFDSANIKYDAVDNQDANYSYVAASFKSKANMVVSIKFISNEVLKPTRAFLIHGQRFACEKLEYNITSKGVSPLVTGYFYKLD